MKYNLLTSSNIFVAILFSTTVKMYAQDVDPVIEIKNVSAQKALAIRVNVPSNTIAQKMGELFGKLYGFLKSNGIQPMGAPFTVYYAFDPNGNTDFELAVPVNDAVKDSGDIEFKEYPAMKTLSTLYTGPYDKMQPTYTAMFKYAKDKKMATRSDIWEIYLTDPGNTKPEKYQTLIYIPLKE